MGVEAARNQDVGEFLDSRSRREWTGYQSGQELSPARKEALIGMAASNKRMLENLTGGDREEFRAYLDGRKELTEQRMWELTAKANENEEKREGQSRKE